LNTGTNGAELIIISHRGYWRTVEEQNSEIAIKRSFQFGFGVETDIRDQDGTLVISHDIPVVHAMNADSFLACYAAFEDPSLPLALNIKSDGLWNLLAPLLEKHSVRNYFVFDMSIPDTLGYIKKGLRFYTRHSEHETDPAFYELAQGVWMDCFVSDWIEEAAVCRHLEAGKKVCIVSPELHKRPHEAWWRFFASTSVSRSPDVMLCTAFPQKARELFYAR
jgi:hypothetical protein